MIMECPKRFLKTPRRFNRNAEAFKKNVRAFRFNGLQRNLKLFFDIFLQKRYKLLQKNINSQPHKNTYK